jgi:hypothetical protein
VSEPARLTVSTGLVVAQGVCFFLKEGGWAELAWVEVDVAKGNAP